LWRTTGRRLSPDLSVADGRLPSNGRAYRLPQKQRIFSVTYKSPVEISA